jgi:hypothetical protein
MKPRNMPNVTVDVLDNRGLIVDRSRDFVFTIADKPTMVF